MLRAVVLALALANLAYWAWTQGWLDTLTGVRASGDREPERLQRQVQPQMLKVLPPAAAASAGPVAAVAAPTCLEAGPFGDAAVKAAEAALQTQLPPGSWTETRTEQAGLWVIAMGRYPSAEALAKKADELRRRHVAFEEVHEPPGLAPGLLLGRFDDRASAERSLVEHGRHGVHSARVVELRPASVSHRLRIENASAALAAQAAALRADALGGGFAPCAARATTS